MIKALLLLLKAGKLGKVLLTGGTMLISVVAYSWVFGWWYAVGFVGLIFAHEMGHYVAARRRGLNVGAPTFIPFLGAWIQLKDMPHDVETEAYVGVAGPLAGTLASLAVYFLAREQASELLLAVAYSGFFLNLFNLIPISPLDGGRVTAVISPRLWLIGAPMLIALLLLPTEPLADTDRYTGRTEPAQGLARHADDGRTGVLHRKRRDAFHVRTALSREPLHRRHPMSSSDHRTPCFYQLHRRKLRVVDLCRASLGRKRTVQRKRRP
jgi:Zn-dependent protease